MELRCVWIKTSSLFGGSGSGDDQLLSRPRIRCEMNGNHRGHNDCSGKITGVGVLTTVLISRTDGILLRVFFFHFFRSVFNEIGLCFSSYRGIYSLSIGRAQRDEKCRLIFFAMPTVYYVFLTSYSTLLQRDTALRTVYSFLLFKFQFISRSVSVCI